MTDSICKSEERDFSKSDGVPNECWELAEIIFTAREKSCRISQDRITPIPAREGYFHGRETANFDMALDCAKAVLKAGWHK